MVKSGRFIFLALLVAGISPGVYAQKTTVTIQASGPGKPISPDLVGIFFEDLNYAADGGLYAELIQNRSFEYSPTEQPDWHPLKFWELQKRYDAYDRRNSKVYVGEYAAHDRGRRNTLRSALAEAAGLTSFERNGDVVTFASYAPLLARRGHTQWTPDMIYFDSTNVYLSANYHVQRIFGHNSGDRYLETTFDPDDTKHLAASSVIDSKSGDLIVKIVNGAEEPADIHIRLAGLTSDVSMRAVKTVLTGPDADAVNKDGEPPVVKPESSIETVTPAFVYTAPACSLTVFRINR